jgi:uncharacterized membrane protein YfcA
MPNPILLLFIALVVIALPYLVKWFQILRASPPGIPTRTEGLIGFVTNFFDTLGIGSFAPTTALFRAFRLVPDEKIPGTLNVGHTLPTLVQAFIYISIVKVEFTTLALLIATSILGSWLGAGVVSKWSRRNIQLGMGVALLVAAGLFVIKNVDEMRGTPLFPGGNALGLHGALLYAAMAGNFVLGALMTLGIGLYAPCLIMISLLGMNPTAAFPIMMGSCAFLMPVASLRFLKAGSVSHRPALGLALAGIPAVLIAAFAVVSMPLTIVRWLVVVVVLYTAVTMIRAGMRTAPDPAPAPAA